MFGSTTSSVGASYVRQGRRARRQARKQQRVRVVGVLMSAILSLGGLLAYIGVTSLPAAATFSDVDFKQCATGTAEPHGCDWINGIVQSSNSQYFEGMANPQRTIFTGISATAGDIHTLTFSFDFTKGGIHAYDWLVSWQQAQTLSTAVGGYTTPLALNECGPAFGGSINAGTCTALVGSGNSVNVPLPSDPFVSKDGSTAAKIAAFEAIYGARSIKIYGNSPIDTVGAPAVTYTHSPAGSGSDTGDSTVTVTLSWHSASSNVLIEFAGHIASAANSYGWGEGLGASSISGGPYHVSLQQLDATTIGQQDNQIKGADIKIFPQLSTTSNPTGAATPGVLATDTASITNGATGTVDFFLCGPGLATAANATTGCPTGGTQIGSSVTLNNGSATSAATTAQQTAQVGLYCWRAVYTPSQGSNFVGTSHTNNTTECFTIAKANSTTVTAIHNAAHQTVLSVSAGTTVHDQATVSGQQGLPTPTGTVTFSWFTNGNCTAPAAATSSTFALSGGVADGTTFTQTPMAPGSYSFQATYSGDGIYLGSTGACEPLGVNKVNSSTATVIHNSSHNTVTSVPAGTIVHDQATVTGQQGLPTPTGNVTFDWFTNGTCANAPAATSGNFALNGSGVADGTTFTQTPNLAGSYSFKAHYAGDSLYNPSDGDCEPLTVTKLNSNTNTVIHNANHQTVTSVPAGTTVHDQATVTGSLITPTGNVTFDWFLNGNCSGAPQSNSGNVALVAGVADATAFTKTPNVSGSFSFQAHYLGDGTYNASDGPCEPLTVTKVNSSTATVIHNAAHQTVTTVPAGTTVHDQATVTGQQGLPTPTGNVTFDWFLNGNCSGAPQSNSGNVALVAGVADATAFTKTPNVSGSFSFQAHYLGDGTYNASDGPCEPLEVTKVNSSTDTVIHNAAHQTVTSVVAGTTVHDQATVTGQQGLPTPTGNVTFDWFLNGNCSGSPQSNSGNVALVAGVADATAFTKTPNTSGSFSFQAHYLGDGTYSASDGPCEPLGVNRVASSTATVIHNAAHQTVTTVPVGTTVHDQATVTGQQGLPTPTGNVNFDWFTNGNCSGTPQSNSGAVALVAGVADATGFTKTPVAAGSFSFQAHYTGDTTYTGSDGPCEPLEVTKVNSSTDTVIHNASHQTVTSVPVGTTVHDQATVTGQQGLPTPTGNVNFDWFTNGTCTGAPQSNSGAVALVAGVADATAFTKTPVVSGSFSFQAHYTGDGTYNASDGPCEPLVVTKVGSSTVTVIHNAAHQTVLSVPAGTTVHDQATVTGQQGLPTPTGTVVFDWFTNNQCSGSPQSSSSPFALNGSGVADGTTFTKMSQTAGGFAFMAHYSGDATYNASDGACEPLEVTKVASSTATVIHNAAHQTVLSVPEGTTVHDQATVTGQQGLPTPSGTVTFAWFTNGTCSGTPAATSSTFGLDSSGVADGTTFTQTPSAGSFAFRATYSGDDTYLGSTGDCEPLTALSVALSLTKTVATPVIDVTPGAQNVSFTIVATNVGQATLNDVVIKDPIPTTPTGLKWVSAAFNPTTDGTCVVTDTLITCTMTRNGGALVSGDKVSIVVTMNVPQSAAGSTITNVASVSSSPPGCVAPACQVSATASDRTAVIISAPAVVTTPLAFTGLGNGWTAYLAAGLVIAGGALVLLARRRRRGHATP